MNTTIKRAMAVLIGLLVMGGTAAFAEAPGFGAKGAEVDSELTLIEMLTYAIQDEYLARAEYELIMSKYGTIRPFSNIIKAEERHIEWVKELLESHGYEIPADTAADHVVLPPDLKSSIETGVQAEIDNIAMYEKFLAKELPEDVREVFEELKRGSENHLRAFRNNLRKYS
jgi:hypothetical protein